MFITQLFENTQQPNILVVYAGRFQPFHKGHHAVFNWLATKYGRNNVYIATSNKQEPLKSPFSFTEKSYFMNLTGVPGDRIVETAQPYQPKELLANYNPQTTLLLFAVSEKDMAEDPRFKVGTKKDGSASYFQHLPANLAETKTFNEHAYLIVTPKFDFEVLGHPMDSASDIRKLYPASDEQTRKLIIKDLFGRYTPEAQKYMDDALGASVQPEVTAPKVDKMYETKVSKYKDLGATKHTTHFIKNVTTGEIMSPHRSKADAEDALVSYYRGPSDGNEYKIVRARKDVAEDAAGVGLVRGGNDPRYVMATTGDQNDVNSKTLGKMMKAYKLVGQKAPKTGQTQVKRNIAESEETVSAVERAIIRRIMNSHLDLLSQHGPAAIMDAARDVADWVGDVDEIGSSDVSAWVNQVERSLGGTVEEEAPASLEDKLRAELGRQKEELDELSTDTLKSYQKKSSDRRNYKDKPIATRDKRFAGNALATKKLDRRAGELDEDGGPIEAYGVVGMNSKPWRKTFKSQAAFEAWLDKNEGNVEVHGTRSLELDEDGAEGKSLADVVRVYSGKPGCMCGCLGKYSETPRSKAIVYNKVMRHPDLEIQDNIAYVQTPTRMLAVYFKDEPIAEHIQEAGPGPVNTEQFQKALQVVQQFAVTFKQFSRDQKHVISDIEDQILGMESQWDEAMLGMLSGDVEDAMGDARNALNVALGKIYEIQAQAEYTARYIQNQIDDAEQDANWKD